MPRWTADETSMAKQMKALGHTSRTIAERLGRSIKSVEAKLYERPKGECGSCGKTIFTRAKSGLCHPCYMTKHNADPKIRAKINEGNLANPDMAKGGKSRLIAGRRGVKTRWDNPEYRERMTALFKEKIMHLCRTPEALARRDWAAHGKAVSEARMAWCPPEYRDLYRILLSKSVRMAEARALIFAQARIDRERQQAEERRAREVELANMTQFERDMLALKNGARLVANDQRPSLSNPANYGEERWTA